jgi:hypothetical protein
LTKIVHLNPGYERFITTNRDIGNRYTFSGLPKGSELLFGIYVRDTGNTFKMGDGSVNPDTIAHAGVEQLNFHTYIVGFEDLLDGGDRDYDDNMFKFTQGITTNSSGIAVPEPSTLIGTVSFGILGGGALLKRGKKRKTLV